MSLTTGVAALFLYQYIGWEWVAIPWLPISLIGIATAFYVGFKNSQSYDRSWEARKIWGAITNNSRSFAAMLRAFTNNDNATTPRSEDQVKAEIRTILYRHIGWLYALMNAMRQPTTWEHSNRASRKQKKALDTHTESCEEEMARYLQPEELRWVKQRKNSATQLLDVQSQHIARLRREGLLDDFRHMELQQMITNLYDEQGKTERIKNTPFPRQYATISAIFIAIFVIMLPFGMIAEFRKLGDGMLWAGDTF